MTVYLHTILQRRTPEGMQRRLNVTLSPGSTFADLLQFLSIRPDDESILYVVNGRQAEPSQQLIEGDEIHLIPALSGGAPRLREGAVPCQG